MMLSIHASLGQDTFNICDVTSFFAGFIVFHQMQLCHKSRYPQKKHNFLPRTYCCGFSRLLLAISLKCAYLWVPTHSYSVKSAGFRVPWPGHLLLSDPLLKLSGQIC
jgi:hypothetical protein